MSAVTFDPRTAPTLTAQDAAARLGEPVKAIYRMCARRELGHVRTRGRLKFSQADLDAWIAARRVPPCHTAGPVRRPHATAPTDLPMPSARRFS